MTEQTHEPPTEATVAFLFEVRELADLPRTGWRYDGVPRRRPRALSTTATAPP
ncbi:hypothetical protein ACWEQL_00130 [Kitasatospora sp. NPDC004240]